jgi:Zn-dependent peptidase ImmA (M78 family)
MRMSLEELEAESAAEEVIADEKIKALPVDPITIARKKGLIVEPKESSKPGVSGSLVKVGNGFGIQYATHINNEGFIRFTVAHELGHYCIPGHPEILFPRGVLRHESRSGFISHEPCERQADFFAATLLMPESLFTDAVRDAGEGFAAIDGLRTMCQTSITSTAIRFARFAEDPVAIVMSSGTLIDFCFMSAPLEECPKIHRPGKGTPLPNNSETFRFNKDKANISRALGAAGYTMLGEWFEGAPDIEMKEDVVGLGGYGKTLTVLFTSEALHDEDEEDDDD